MKNLELTQKTQIIGGCRRSQEEALLWISGATTRAAFVPGANLILGPTAVGSWIGSAFCFYRK